jgi:hypothetical protein
VNVFFSGAFPKHFTKMNRIHDQVLSNAGLTTAASTLGDALRIRVITFNLGDNEKTQDQWLDELKTWKELNRFDYDILGFALQEDFANFLAYGHLMQALTMFLSQNGFKLAVSDSTNPLKFNEPFAVKAALFIRSSIFDRSFIAPTAYIAKKSICLGSWLRRLACTKASVGVSIRLGAPYMLHLTLIGSHMPIETKKEDLGYEARISAMNQTVNSVVNKLVTPSSNSNMDTLLIWTGDLNFRKDLQRNDQLTKALEASSGFGMGLKENVELLASINPTCKLVSCHGGQQCPNCRQNPQTADAACFDAGGKHGKAPKVPRVPSNCDRVLYRFWPRDNNDQRLSAKKYAAFVENAVLQSDHNAVKADFELISKQ